VIYLMGWNLLGMLIACRKDGLRAGLIELNQCDLKKSYLNVSRKSRLKLTIKILFCNYVLRYFSYWGGLLTGRDALKHVVLQKACLTLT